MSGKPSRQYYFDENYFHIIDSPDKAYFLGLIAADGCVRNSTRGQPCVALSLLFSDLSILESFNKCLCTNKPIFTTKNGKYRKVSFPSEIMAEDLSKYNIVPQKTYAYEMVDLGVKYMSHFFRGYFDGDGSIFETNGKTTLSRFKISICGFEHNMLKMKEYLNNFGISVKYKEDRRKYKYPFGSIKADSAKDIYMFIKYLYRDCNGLCIQRKRDISNRFLM